jgi:hypothetical protein
MAKDDDDDDSLPPLGENCDKFLDQAKKGQPRSFLLVCKGNKVKYLAVKKKPVKKAELAEAKKSGYKGDAYFGVITGKGMDLVFNLSMEDGYTGEPCKDKSLKDFLEEHAGFKCKPTFAIVATAPAIPFDEDDLKNPLIARFMAMGEQISNVLDVRPEAEAELTKTVTAIRLLLQDGDFTTAEPLVIALAARLQELLSGGQATTPAATPTATPSSPTPTPVESSQPTPTVDNDALKNKLQEALNKLVPQLKQAVATYPDKKVELLTPVAQIKKQMDAGELQEAKQGILAVGQLLKLVMAQGNTANPPAQPENDLLGEYERKLASLQPSYARALKDMLGDTSKFRTVMAYAMEQAEAGVYGNAIKAIDRLTQAIGQANAAGAKETAASPQDTDQLAEWERRVNSLEQRVLEAQKTRAGETNWMTMFMTAQDLGSDGDFAKALIVLDRLEEMLNATPAVSDEDEAEEGGGSLVALQTARLKWSVARDRVAAELREFEAEILELYADDPNIAELRVKLRKLDSVLGGFERNLIEDLDAAYNAERKDRLKQSQAALMTAKGYLARVKGDAFVQKIATNPIFPVRSIAALRQTLSLVVKNLGG